jgi:hypothetical protein
VEWQQWAHVGPDLPTEKTLRLRDPLQGVDGELLGVERRGCGRVCLEAGDGRPWRHDIAVAHAQLAPLDHIHHHITAQYRARVRVRQIVLHMQKNYTTPISLPSHARRPNRRLAMLTRVPYLPIHSLQPHHPRRNAHAPSQVHNLALDVHLGPLGCRSQIRAVQSARDMARVPEPVAAARRHGRGRADVKDVAKRQHTHVILLIGGLLIRATAPPWRFPVVLFSQQARGSVWVQ